jgi:hypothetical protein
LNKNYEIEFKELAAMFRNAGTLLDEQWLRLIKEVLLLILAAKNQTKVEYVAISGKAIHEAGELVRLIETSFDKSSGQKQFITGSLLFNNIKKLCRQLKHEHVKQVLVATRLAVGAWPPPNSVNNMITSACALCKSSRRILQWANALGIWPVGSIDLSQFSLVQIDTIIPSYTI